jgi:hypothetical protein
MNDDAVSIVITTINPPTPSTIGIRDSLHLLNAKLLIIGDSKSPADFSLPGATYLDLEAQRATGFTLAVQCPTGHYARKNVGYLAAMRAGADIIVETDDDNAPEAGFWAPRTATAQGRLVTRPGWCNVYRYFTDHAVWPRGLPIEQIKQGVQPASELAAASLYSPIQQGLANGDPDVDAIYRLTSPLPIVFDDGAVTLDRGVWCPFNSQNTTFWRPAFPLLYLPCYCSFRMTDIWRSFVAQRIAWENDWRISFHGPTVFQDRNEHDLLRDFEQEIPGYLNNDRIRLELETLSLRGGVENIGQDLCTCYRALIRLGVIGADEEGLLASWLDDIRRIADAAPIDTRR